MTTLHTIELLPAPLVTHRRIERLRALWISVGAIGLCLSGTALGVIHGVVLSGGVPGVAELARTEAELERLRNESASIRADAERIAVGGRLGIRMSQRPDWGLVLAMLESLRGEGVVLVAVSCATEDGADGLPGGRARIIVEGLAESQGAAQRYLLDVERCGMFSSARLGRTVRADAPSRVLTAFTVDLQIDPETLDAG
ncbi:MAG: hypothetical protein AAF356_10520 [Planctomycetota bacterium]